MSDTWVTGTGLTSNYDGEVVEAFFATDARYQDGEVPLLFLKNKPTDGTEVQSDDGLIQESFPCGKSWEIGDGGKNITGGKKIQKGTAMASLIDRIVTLAGGPDEASEIFGGGKTIEASTWVGLRAHWDEFTEGGKIGAEGWSRTKNYPSALLGRSDSPANSGDSTLATITEYAKRPSMDYATWIDKCMKLTGVSDDATLVARLSDEGWYNELRDS